MRTKKTLINFSAALFQQLVTGISGLIVPRMFIAAYGSEVNGMISSINQFLSYITFFEAGLCGVILSQLYKPLANNDYKSCNEILADARNFFNKIAAGYVIYVTVLIVLYPHLVDSDKSTVYISSLVAILSISLLFQYLFGIVNSILLQAKQEGYIYSFLQSIVVVINAVVVIVCTRLNTSVHFLKMLAVLVAIISPLGLMIYVKAFNKQINITVKGSSKNIKQRWDGMIHHICYYVQSNIDVMLLTFVDLKLVSVYSVYYMVTYTLRKIFETFLTSFRSAMGDLYARGEIEKTKQIFSMLEFIVYTLTVIIYTSVGFSIIPFIRLYTKGIYDVNYINLPFSIMLIMAEVFYTIRIPYHTMVNCTGCFKETKGMAIQEATINAIVSISLVYKLGIVGVAIGTAASCLFRTIRYYIFFSNHVLYLNMQKILKRVLVALLSASLCMILFKVLDLKSDNFGIWIVNGLIYTTLATVIAASINAFFFKDDCSLLLSKIKLIK
ncbi:MAG TPA: sugar isomerase [Lachnoclostridium sp.]|nr:sugar isomerase [Lachnoclostridium sp.]